MLAHDRWRSTRRRFALTIAGLAAAVAVAAASYSASDVMAVGRTGAVGILLSDGRVLVAGGWDGASAVSSAEIFDPGTGLFSASTASLAVGRAAATALPLQDGKVLIAGGHDGTAPVAIDELYDPATNSFTTVDATPIVDPALDALAAASSVNPARHGHAATRLADGRVLITGGLDESALPIVTAELYDPADGLFHPAGVMLSARADHGAVLLANGDVLVVGGRDANGALSTAERYDAATGLFTPAAGLTDARMAPVAIALLDGRIFVAGGTDTAGVPLATAELYVVPPPPAPQSTSTDLTSNRSTSVYGQPITYVATVSGTDTVPTGEVRFLDGGTLLLGSATLNSAGVASLTTTMTPAGTRAITAAYDGSALSNGSTSSAVDVTVTKASTTSSLSVSPTTQQYSDLETFQVTVSGAYGGPPADGANFKVGLQQMNDDPVPFTPAGPGVWKATLVAPLLEKTPPGQLRPTGTNKIASATFSGVSPNYTVPNPTSKAFLLLKEDARVTYDGPLAVLTASKISGKATIKLRATVRDISATLEAGLDTNPGDIRLAQVMFFNRTTNMVIATVNVTLIDPNVTTVGVATYDWAVDIGNAAAKTFTVGMVVSNYYNRNSALDNANIVVTRHP